MASTIHDKHAHLIGIGRPAVVCPELPRALMSVPGVEYLAIPAAPRPGWLKFINTGLIGAGIDTAWHCALMWRIGNGSWAGVQPYDINAAQIVQRVVPTIGAFKSLFELWRP